MLTNYLVLAAFLDDTTPPAEYTAELAALEARLATEPNFAAALETETQRYTRLNADVTHTLATTIRTADDERRLRAVIANVSANHFATTNVTTRETLDFKPASFQHQSVRPVRYAATIRRAALGIAAAVALFVVVRSTVVPTVQPFADANAPTFGAVRGVAHSVVKGSTTTGNIDAATAKAAALYSTGKYAEAIAPLRIVVAAQPDDHDAALALAYALTAPALGKAVAPAALEEARGILETVRNTRTAYADDATFQLAVLERRGGNPNTCDALLKTIAPASVHYAQAQKMLTSPNLR